MNKLILICISILILITLLLHFKNKEKFDTLYWWESVPVKGNKIISKDKLREREEGKQCDVNMYKELAKNPDSDLDDVSGIYDNYIHDKYNDDESPHILGEIDDKNITGVTTSHIRDEPRENILEYDNYFQPTKEDFKLEDYYKLQLLKKIPLSLSSYENEIEYNDSFLNFTNNLTEKKNEKKVDIQTPPNQENPSPYETVRKITEKKNSLNQEEYYDLFGLPVRKKDKTDFVLSRTYPSEDNTYRDVDWQINQKKLQTFKCKRCPIPTIQNYMFRLSNEMFNDIASSNEPENTQSGLIGTDAAEYRDRRNYFVEKGGTYFDEESKKCKLCSYQQGCFYPKDPENDKENVRLKYQETGCGEISPTTGKEMDRKCVECRKCSKGKEFIKVYCGEGGGHQNTVCGDCNVCDPIDEFKLDGCSKDDTTKNSKCKPKSVCYGYDTPEEERIYYDSQLKNSDLQNGFASYEVDPGYAGGFFPDEDSFLQNYKTVNGLNDSDEKFIKFKKSFNFEDYKQKGYMGKDRVCKPCKPCGMNEQNVGGCQVNNSKSDTKCAKIDKTYNDIKKEADSLQTEYGTYHDNTNLLGEHTKSTAKEILNENFQNVADSKKNNNKNNNNKNNVDNYRLFLKKEFPKYTNSQIDELLNTIRSNDTLIFQLIKKTLIRNNPSIKEQDIDQIINLIKSGNISDLEAFTFNENKIREIISRDCTPINQAPFPAYVDMNDPGCEGSNDTKFVPYTKCKGLGKPHSAESERIIKEGTNTSDRVCGPCRCPEGYVGKYPKCNGTADIPQGCEKNVLCKNKDPNNIQAGETEIIGLLPGNNEPLLYTYDKPKLYGDITGKDRCKVCDTECPKGSYQLEPCDPKRSTNIVCKDHSICDPETQIAIQQGDQFKDTICHCIDGYQVHTDENGIPDYSKPCKKIKGKCWENPCNENALCYDNFKTNEETGEQEFVDFNCVCDIKNNWIETEKLGVGPDGCKKLESSHSHQLTNTPNLAPPMEEQYKDLLYVNPSAFNIIAHTQGLKGSDINPQIHHDSSRFHIHK